LAYLLTQKDVDPARLAVGGSSCGATDAVDLAARRRDIRAVFLLSGLPSLGGRAYLAATPLLPVFGIYAEEDLGAASMRSAIGVSKHPQSTLKMFPGSGHGVELFQQHPDLQAATVKWLRDQVSTP
jgi:dienelactone hydrolase